jgi:hypothetical protein
MLGTIRSIAKPLTPKANGREEKFSELIKINEYQQMIMYWSELQ